MADREDLIKFYFSLGVNHREILYYLAHLNGIVISMRTLRRILKTAGLFKRKHYSDVLNVSMYIVELLHTSSKSHGYKFVHLKCLQAGFIVTQKTVRLLLQILDAEGVEFRKRRRIKRRSYFNHGPNFCWHVDGYDKLKPYGICISGAIDGYSRHMLWLKAFSTNNDPAVIAGYYLDVIEEKSGCPARIRTDLGTENTRIRDMQMALRYNHADDFAQRSFIAGSSTHNQRIEAWWTFLRTHFSQFWMDLFQGLKENDSFIGDFLDKNLVQFVFTKIIQVYGLIINDVWILVV